MFALGSMFGAGTAVQISINLGEGKQKRANEVFTTGITYGMVFGVLFMTAMILWLRPICLFLGATDRTIGYCMSYGLISCIAIPIGILKEMEVYILRADDAPRLSMIISIVGGVVNIILDYVLIKIFHMGIAGAAYATLAGMAVGAILGGFHFFTKRTHLSFIKMKFNFEILKKIMINGQSNFINNFASSVITYLYNLVTLPIVGEEGVAAVTIVLYAQFLFLSIFTGYMSGATPILGFNYGAGKVEENKKVFRFCIKLVLVTSLISFLISQLLGSQMISVMLTDAKASRIANHGLRIYAFGFLAAGINIFGAGIFTAYGDGKQGSVIAFCRTFIFLGIGLIFLPRFLGVDGIWIAGAATEFFTLFITLF